MARSFAVGSMVALALGLAGCVVDTEPLGVDEASSEGLAVSPEASGDESPSLSAAVSRLGAIQGVLGGYERGRVWGWAHRVGDEEPVRVRIEVDGRTVATLLASELRDDLVDKGIHPTGEAGFTAEIGELPVGADVDAVVDGPDGREAHLANGPCLVQGDVGVSSCTEGMARGILGGYQDGKVWGWAQVVGRREPVAIRVTVDGVTVAVALADRPRPDLVAKRLHPSGAAGFEVQIGEVEPGARIEVSVDEDGTELLGSPLWPVIH